MTHKLNLSLISDKILLLSQDGKNEVGTHEELYHNDKSRYSNLYDTYLQTAKMERENMVVD